MKKTIVVFLISVLSVASFSALSMGHYGYNKKERVEKYLQLTDEQAEQFHAIMKAQHEKRKEYRESAREETLSQLSGILNEEQLEKMKAHMDKRKNRKKGMHCCDK